MKTLAYAILGGLLALPIAAADEPVPNCPSVTYGLEPPTGAVGLGCLTGGCTVFAYTLSPPDYELRPECLGH